MVPRSRCIFHGMEPPSHIYFLQMISYCWLKLLVIKQGLFIGFLRIFAIVQVQRLTKLKLKSFSRRMSVMVRSPALAIPSALQLQRILGRILVCHCFIHELPRRPIMKLLKKYKCTSQVGMLHIYLMPEESLLLNLLYKQFLYMRCRRRTFQLG